MTVLFRKAEFLGFDLREISFFEVFFDTGGHFRVGEFAVKGLAFVMLVYSTNEVLTKSDGIFSVPVLPKALSLITCESSV